MANFLCLFHPRSSKKSMTQQRFLRSAYQDAEEIHTFKGQWIVEIEMLFPHTAKVLTTVLVLPSCHAAGPTVSVNPEQQQRQGPEWFPCNCGPSKSGHNYRNK